MKRTKEKQNKLDGTGIITRGLSRGADMDRASKFLEKLNLPALKRECIARGMPFEEVSEATVLKLQSWFLKNFPNKVNINLINEFDDWVENILKKRGVDPVLLDPIFRLGQIGARNEDGEVVKKKRVTGLIHKPLKEKRAKTTEGLFTGTKKAYTFELQKQGLSKDEVISKVKEKFPEAVDKSISIWFNKAKKANKK